MKHLGQQAIGKFADLAARSLLDETREISFHAASLYPTLYRMEDRELIEGRWIEKAGQRRRRYYRITEQGRAMLATQREDWGRFIAALTQIAGVKPA